MDSNKKNKKQNNIIANKTVFVNINTPTLQRHKILTLSDIDLSTISFDVMMSWYGEADGGGTCAGDFGNKLINRWRRTKETYCTSQNSTSAAASSSRIDCYLVRQTRHGGEGDNLCVMQNVSVNMGLFGDDNETAKIINNYVQTKHHQAAYLKPKLGFIQGTCSPVASKWQDRYMPGWNSDWTTRAYQRVPSLDYSSHLTCSEWIEHPVLIVQRDTFANLFHGSEDMVNVFIAFAILQWRLRDVQVYLTDLYPKGPFW